MPGGARHTVLTQSADDQTIPKRPRYVMSIQNDSGAAVYVRLGHAASTTAYTVKMANGSHYEVPGSFDGEVHVIWASPGSGKLQVTEVTD